MTEAFICDGVRTPIGRYGGALAHIRTDDLAALPISLCSVTHPRLGGVTRDYGRANQAGEDNWQWRAWLRALAGMPVSVPGCTINRLRFGHGCCQPRCARLAKRS